MAETEPSRKRFREEGDGEEGEETKRRSCSYHKILSLLESEEEEPTQDVSSLISTLQQELSSDPPSEPADPNQSSLENPTSPPPPVFKEEEDEMMMIRHLLEASDDELGIPTPENERGFEEEIGKISTYDGFWEMEDEAANYYTLLQSELFM
ncbi:uncharacterized protein LOC131242136 [Magnolia sinica]|uniref:uncharacterized protein LOC131242136 n=1 Tax=Magnolia sinica TaxID=86752 RepID=UPI00265A6119|nr:uncharacterized protein LOC131242136 [Magnolia sinica]